MKSHPLIFTATSLNLKQIFNLSTVSNGAENFIHHICADHADVRNWINSHDAFKLKPENGMTKLLVTLRNFKV